MKNWTEKIAVSLKGMAMGIAEIIPGVSGGTIALITGIYEQLIESIKSILGPEVWTTWRKQGLAAAWEKASGLFLVFLLAGMVLGIVLGAFGVKYIEENYPVFLWSFFFGLILASALYVGRQVKNWSIKEIAALVIGALVAYAITILSPAQGSESLVLVFFAGAIAISALILPGISGSFILLLMGMYSIILGALTDGIKTQDAGSLIIMVVFGLGCLIGLATFSRVLSWMFKRFHDLTMALLAGFMLGSLNKIWPWRNVISTRINSSGEEVPFLEKSVLPGAFEGDAQVIGVIILVIIGFGLVFILDRFGKQTIKS